MRQLIITILVYLTLAACSGGGGGGSATTPTEKTPTAPTAPTVEVNGEAVKYLQFVWSPVTDASGYKLFEDPDGASGYSQIGDDIPSDVNRYTLPLALHQRARASYILQSCNNNGCTDSLELELSPATLQAATGYVKASNTDPFDEFGYAVALSDDGLTLAVGAPEEQSFAEEADNSGLSTGAVYLYRFDGTRWQQQAYLKASNAKNGDEFGGAVSLSADGNTLAVGASGVDPASGGFGRSRARNSGAAYVFRFDGNSWVEQAFIEADNRSSGARFGNALTLSNDGNTLAIAAYDEFNGVTGINNTASVAQKRYSGAAYVFRYDSTGWAQEVYIKANATDVSDKFGTSLSLSSDGNTLAIGAPLEDSTSTGGELDNTLTNSGAAYVFNFDGNNWAQTALIKTAYADADDNFGHALSLNASGDVLAVAAPYEDGNAIGTLGDATVNDVNTTDSGAVYLFELTNNAWLETAYIKASNTDGNDQFGYALSLSEDGNTLVVGANLESSYAQGMDGDQQNNIATASGAAYLFTNYGQYWAQQVYLKAPNTGSEDRFGQAISLSADATTLAIGALQEESQAFGINGDQTDDTAANAGAVYLY